jgi:hypothetical protein
MPYDPYAPSSNIMPEVTAMIELELPAPLEHATRRIAIVMHGKRSAKVTMTIASPLYHGREDR